MKQKIIALVIVLATGLLVWAVISSQPKAEPVPPAEEMVSTFLYGEVKAVSGNRIRFMIGESEFVARVSEGTQIVKSVAIFGDPQLSAGTIDDIKPGTQVTVWYSIPKSRNPSDPLVDLNADKIEVEI
jgi:hypothetical protein